MLRGLFDLDNPVMRFLSRVADVLTLNLLFLLCSIPVFTIGASTTAMYYCFFKMKDNEEGYLSRRFFKSFKENFRQATIIWIIMLLMFLLLLTEFLMMRNIPGREGTTARAIVIFGLVLWYLIFTYTFALQSRFYNSIRSTFKNAVLLIFANGPRSIAIAAVIALIIGFSVTQTNELVFWNLILFWILFLFALITLINVELMYPIFRKLMPEETLEESVPDSQFVIDEEADLSNIGYAPAPPREEDGSEENQNNSGTSDVIPEPPEETPGEESDISPR